MKKTLIIIFSILFIANIFWAQEDNANPSNQIRNNSNIWDNYVENPVNTWVGFKYGLGVTDITSPNNISTSGGVSLGQLLGVQLNYYFSSSLGVTFNIGFTFYSYSLKETSTSWWDENNHTFSTFDVSIGPILKLKNFILYFAPYVGLKIRSTFYNNEDAKTTIYGISAGFGVNIKISRKSVVPVTIDFKMTINEPLYSLKNSRLWGIFISAGYLFGLD